MATPAVTNTFTANSVIYSSEVNQNFTDIIDALTDTTADLDIGSLNSTGGITMDSGVLQVGTSTGQGIHATFVRAASGATVNAEADDWVFEGTSNTGMSILYNGTQKVSLFLGSSTNPAGAFVRYSESSKIIEVGSGVTNTKTYIYSNANIAINCDTANNSISFFTTVVTSASTTARASLRIPSGTAPSSPTSGDMWYDGSNLLFRDGSTTRTITWT